MTASTGRPTLISLRKIASMLGKSWDEVYAMHRAGTLPVPTITLNCQLWVRREDWDAWMASTLTRLEARAA